MRRHMIFIVLSILLIPNVFARKQPNKAGKVSDYVYEDKEYKFKLTLNDDWKYRIQDNDDACRMVLTQVDFAIPPDYNDSPDYTKIPRVAVFLVESNMSANAFIDSLVSDSYNSDVKGELLKEFEILRISGGSGFSAEKLVPRGRDEFDIGPLRAYTWSAQVKYTNEISMSASSIGGKRVKGAYGGEIIAVKKGNQMLVFHTICEWQYYNTVKEAVNKVVTTLKWE